MKKLVALLVTLTVTTAGMWGQNTANKLKQIVDNWMEYYDQNAHWIHEDHTLFGHSLLLNPYLGNPSDSLKSISDSINALVLQNPSHTLSKNQFFNYKMAIADYRDKHPKERAEANILLGDLYRYANPLMMHNTDRAGEYYYMAYLQAPLADKHLRGAINQRMAFSHVMDLDQTSDFTYTIYHLYMATRDDAYFASGLGKCFMLGLGAYKDYGLAMALFDLGAMCGDDNCYLYYNIMRYDIEHPARNAQETLAKENCLKYLTETIISSSHEDAWTSLQYAVQGGSVVAKYLQGQLLNKILDSPIGKKDEDFLKREVFRLYRQAADAGFMPAFYDLSLFCAQYTFDTAQGNIFVRDKNGKYRDKDRKTVLMQALHMMEKASDNHYYPAHVYLGELYGKGGELNIPARNYESSAHYLLIASRRGNKACIEKLRGYTSGGLISNERMAVLSHEAEETEMMHNIARSSIGQQTLNMQRNNPFIRTPYSYYMESIHYPSAINSPDPLLTDIMEQCYHMVYDKYAQMLSESLISKTENDPTVSDSHNMYLRIRMKDLREAYNRRKIGLPIVKSYYEDAQ